MGKGKSSECTFDFRAPKYSRQRGFATILFYHLPCESTVSYQTIDDHRSSPVIQTSSPDSQSRSEMPGVSSLNHESSHSSVMWARGGPSNSYKQCSSSVGCEPIEPKDETRFNQTIIYLNSVRSSIGIEVAVRLCLTKNKIKMQYM